MSPAHPLVQGSSLGAGHLQAPPHPQPPAHRAPRPSHTHHVRATPRASSQAPPALVSQLPAEGVGIEQVLSRGCCATAGRCGGTGEDGAQPGLPLPSPLLQTAREARALAPPRAGGRCNAGVAPGACWGWDERQVALQSGEEEEGQEVRQEEVAQVEGPREEEEEASCHAGEVWNSPVQPASRCCCADSRSSSADACCSCCRGPPAGPLGAWGASCEGVEAGWREGGRMQRLGKGWLGRRGAGGGSRGGRGGLGVGRAGIVECRHVQPQVQLQEPHRCMGTVRWGMARAWGAGRRRGPTRKHPYRHHPPGHPCAIPASPGARDSLAAFASRPSSRNLWAEGGTGGRVGGWAVRPVAARPS
jgi:hypothetical protein